MNKALFTATEIASQGILGLPVTKKGIIDRAEREGWYSEERTGLGGKHKVYEIPARYLAGQGLAVPSQGTKASRPNNVVHLDLVREQRMLEIGRAVDQWLMTSRLVMDLDKKYLLIQLLYRYFEREKELDKEKLADFIRKLA